MDISSEKVTKRVCIRVKELRKIEYKSLEHWLKCKDNIYCGRYGRIFITEKKTGESKTRKIFNYKSSIFHNPFKLILKGSVSSGVDPLNKCLEDFEKYLILKINDDTDFVDQLLFLEGKNLGCWCEYKNRCHVDILIKHIRILALNNKS